jgi:hypothetical protein
MQLTPTLTLLELVNGLAALFGLFYALQGWAAARDDYHVLESIPGAGPARLAQGKTNLRIQQTLTVKTAAFLTISIIVGLTPGGATFSFTPGGAVLIILTMVNVLIGLTSFMIQRTRWTILGFRETNRVPNGVA